MDDEDAFFQLVASASDHHLPDGIYYSRPLELRMDDEDAVSQLVVSASNHHLPDEISYSRPLELTMDEVDTVSQLVASASNYHLPGEISYSRPLELTLDEVEAVSQLVASASNHHLPDEISYSRPLEPTMNEVDTVSQLVASASNHHLPDEISYSRPLEPTMNEVDTVSQLVASASNHHLPDEISYSRHLEPTMNEVDTVSQLVASASNHHLPDEISYSRPLEPTMNEVDTVSQLVASASNHHLPDEISYSRPLEPTMNEVDTVSQLVASASNHHLPDEISYSRPLELTLDEVEAVSQLVASASNHHLPDEISYSRPLEPTMNEVDTVSQLVASASNHHLPDEISYSRPLEPTMNEVDTVSQLVASASNHHLPDEISYSRTLELTMDEVDTVSQLVAASASNHHLPDEISYSRTLELTMDEVGTVSQLVASASNHHLPGEISYSRPLELRMHDEDAFSQLVVSANHHHLPDGISYSRLPELVVVGSAAALHSSDDGASTSPSSVGDPLPASLSDEENLSLYPIVEGHHDPQFVSISQEVDRMRGDERINIGVSTNRDSNEISNEAAHIAAPVEYLSIESEHFNSSTIPQVSASSNLPLDDEENEPPSKFAKIELPMRNDNTNEDNDGQTCSICLEGWTASGEHRLSALKCGHLFGHSCINRWLKQSNRNNRCCPSCKTRASYKDIHFIYAKRIAVVDNSEIESLKTQLEKTKSEKNRIEMDLHKAMSSQLLFFNKITKLEREIVQLKQAGVQTVCSPVKKYALHVILEMWKDASCSVLAYNSRNKELYVSQMNTNCLFQGYAMRKVSCHDWKLGKLVHLHPKLIRDAAYSEENDLLVTVGLDKAVKLSQSANETITTTISAEMPLWSCCWDDSNQNRFYVGGDGGIVLEYDIRQPRAFITRIAPGNDMSPVASLAYAPGGVLACHQNSFRAHCNSGSTYESRTMPIDGSLFCVRRNKYTEDILVSSRPSRKYRRSRHMLCKLSMSNDFDFEVTKMFKASNVQSLMTRSAIYSIGNESFVTAHSESDKAVCIWSVNSERRSLLTASDNVVDILPITRKYGGDLTHLVMLSQSKIYIYDVV